ncbi:hypothetical protein BDV3_003998 [Batrachochytrium dendrobatidis]|uniref:non-specific serine/threonine protein kinase n=1 Tax=Batrachochytrium dendrobatidis (strain JEL423) TaxID=403673 RepID=A0A177WFI0_BATDL|nr:cAMP-dependent protein kinase catalytic subunit [Batrachochytrium dendrobatidis]KAK5669889.1 cAMP-dependent protein kinase catalytic subunit [Batrachochytrium dendrobatidis]OAJ38444.1 hypothetical protein BDEG_22375 [Batrachochytrium dendrobatidis JEL423]
MSEYEEIIDSSILGPIVLDSVIGSGSFASVYLAHPLNNPSVNYAVKRIPLKVNPITGSSRISRTVRTEIKAMCKLSNYELAVKLFDVVESNNHINLIMEHCPMDMFTALCEHNGGKGIQSVDIARTLILQLIDAVMTFHARGIYHRDLKPDNILLSQSEGMLKLCDFGLATFDLCSTEFGCGSKRYMSPECYEPVMISKSTSNAPVSKDGVASDMQHDSGFANSNMHMSSPSAVSSQPTSEQHHIPYNCVLDDTWSVGILILNILAAKNPWEVAGRDDANFCQYINNPMTLVNSFNLTSSMARVVCSLLHPDPAQRCSLASARETIANIPAFIRTPASAVVSPPVSCRPAQQSQQLRPRYHFPGTKTIQGTITKTQIETPKVLSSVLCQDAATARLASIPAPTPTISHSSRFKIFKHPAAFLQSAATVSLSC